MFINLGFWVNKKGFNLLMTESFSKRCIPGYSWNTSCCLIIQQLNIALLTYYFSFGESSKSNRSDSGTFNVRAKAKTVLNVGFILAVSILAIWLNDNPDSNASWLCEYPSLVRIFFSWIANALIPSSSNINFRSLCCCGFIAESFAEKQK